MNIDEIRKELKSYKYKPDWEFHVLRGWHHTGQANLIITFKALDSKGFRERSKSKEPHKYLYQ